jgi:hypothetical protein
MRTGLSLFRTALPLSLLCFSLCLRSQTVPGCQTSELAIDLTSVSDGMGSDSIGFDLTNQSHRTCTLFGYPTVVALNRKGEIVREIHFEHLTTIHGRDLKLEKIQLRPGDRAWFEIDSCHPAGDADYPLYKKVTELRITPPLNKKSFNEHYSFQTCRPDVYISFLVAGSAND